MSNSTPPPEKPARRTLIPMPRWLERTLLVVFVVGMALSIYAWLGFRSPTLIGPRAEEVVKDFDSRSSTRSILWFRQSTYSIWNTENAMEKKRQTDLFVDSLKTLRDKEINWLMRISAITDKGLHFQPEALPADAEQLNYVKGFYDKSKMESIAPAFLIHVNPYGGGEFTSKSEWIYKATVGSIVVVKGKVASVNYNLSGPPYWNMYVLSIVLDKSYELSQH